MRALFGVVLVLALAALSCVTRSTARHEAEAAFRAGQQQQAQTNQPAIFFRGNVKNRLVPWSEELTLSKALLAAEYQGRSDPLLITVTRNGQTFRINIRRLLRGEEDPLLEPGDLVDVQR